MVIISVPALFVPSVAVTVIALSPNDKLILEIDQLVVPLAVPLPPLLLLHVTTAAPLVLSEALPPKLTVLFVVVWIEVDVGLVMVIMGAVASSVIESLTPADTFPAASLYHAYTALSPSALLNVYEILPV